MLTERHLWILIIAILVTGAIVTLYVLPAWWADHRSQRSAEQRLTAAVRRRS